MLDRKPLAHTADPADRPVTFWERFLCAERSAFRRYGVAVVLALLSVALIDVTRDLGSLPLSSLALVTVIATAMYGGRGPALLDTAITALAIDYFFGEPAFRILDSWDSILRIIVFASVGFVVAHLVNSLRQAYRDLHERHREAERAKKGREEVLAVVSHDLRSPLSAIVMNAEALRRALAHGGHLPEAAPKQLDSIKRSADRMSRLIQDLLDAVKIEAGHFRIERDECELRAIVEEAVENARAPARIKGVRIVVTGDSSEPIRACCDRARLTQALDNLLGNAVKFSPENGTVTVTWRAGREAVRIHVKDNGPGIPQERLPHLFTRRWQAAGTAHLGTGLGLFITKSVVEAHGGRIHVRSRPGAGALFSISIPTARALAATAA